MSMWVDSNTVEPIYTRVLDFRGNGLTGLNTIQVSIVRNTDNFYLDWSDNTFKTLFAVGQKYEQMSEVNAVGSPGLYNLDSVDHPNGLNLTQITNLDTVSELFIQVEDSTINSLACSLPAASTLRVGGILDNLDQPVSENVNESEVLQALESLGLNYLVNEDATSNPADGNSILGQICNKLEGVAGYEVYQGFSYNRQSGLIEGVIWVEYQNKMLTQAELVDADLEVFDHNNNSVLQVSSITPSLNGFFKFTAPPSTPLVSEKLYTSKATVDVLNVGEITGGKASFTL